MVFMKEIVCAVRVSSLCGKIIEMEKKEQQNDSKIHIFIF